MRRSLVALLPYVQGVESRQDGFATQGYDLLKAPEAIVRPLLLQLLGLSPRAMMPILDGQQEGVVG